MIGRTERAAIRPYRPWKRWAIGAFVVALYVWAVWGLEGLSWRRIASGYDGILRIIGVMFPPDWSYAHPTVTQGIIESIEIALLGSTMAALLAVPFGFLAAQNVNRVVSRVGKFLLDLIRTFPEILLAVVFMKAVGPGAYAGVMAVGVHSIGMLGKLYAESVETIDPGPVEALRASGANSLQIAWYAVLPQVMPEFLSYAIYRFEINVRAATVLGLVGAGGIGTPLIFNLQRRNWDRVAMILLGVIVAVSVIDWISARVRKKLVEG